MELLKAVFSVGSSPRLYNEDPRPPELMIDRVEGWQSRVELCKGD
jgi:hypothetical protein